MANGIKYQTHELLNKVLNAGEDALKVDIDNVTLTTEGGDVAIDVALDKANDSVTIYANTAADGTGTSTVPLVDAAGNLQIDIVSSALPSGGATAANQATIIGHVDGLETLLTGIDADTNAIKIDAAAIEALIITLDGVQDSALSKLGEIETTNNANQVLLGTIDSDTDAIKTAVQILDNAISGTEMQVDVVAALPAGNNNIGNVDIVSLPASTNTIEVVGDAAENANAAGNPVLVGGRYDASGTNDGGLRTLGTTDVGALALDPKGVLLTKDFTGQAGSILVTGTGAIAAGYGKFIAIQFIEDTVFSSSASGLSGTDLQRWPDDTGVGSDISSNGAVIDGVTFPQGMTIFGRWDGFTLASGKVIAYIGYV